MPDLIILDVILPGIKGREVCQQLKKDKATKESYPWQQRRGLEVYKYGLKHKALLRPLGNVIYFMPPYVITAEEIQLLVDVAERGIELATKD